MGNDQGDQGEEVAVRASCEAGQWREAADQTLALYGPGVLRFLHVRLRDSERAREAYSVVCEDLWRGLPSFAWRASLRTWMFVLARNAASRLVRAERRERSLRGRVEQQDVPQGARTTTAAFKRTETKERMRALRERLDDDQQTLLVLRIERMLSFRELALVMGEVDETASEDEYERASARVRTRFQTAKRRLRELAREAGLLVAREEPQ